MAVNHLDQFISQYDSLETQRAYRRDITVFFEFAKKDPKDITRFDAILYLNHLKKKFSSSSISRMVSSLKSYMKFLMFMDMVIKNPFEGMKLPRINKKEEEGITDAEIKRIRKFFRTNKEKAIIYLMLYNGLRRSEICDLNYGDIKNDTIEIRGKGDKTRVRPLHKLCISAIVGYLMDENRTKGKSDEHIFRRKDGKRLDPERIYSTVKTLCRRAKIKRRLHPHQFRAKFASLALESGVPITTVQEDLGHSSIETTAIYDHSKRMLERSSVHKIEEIK